MLLRRQAQSGPTEVLTPEQQIERCRERLRTAKKCVVYSINAIGETDVTIGHEFDRLRRKAETLAKQLIDSQSAHISDETSRSVDKVIREWIELIQTEQAQSVIAARDELLAKQLSVFERLLEGDDETAVLVMYAEACSRFLEVAPPTNATGPMSIARKVLRTQSHLDEVLYYYKMEAHPKKCRQLSFPIKKSALLLAISRTGHKMAEAVHLTKGLHGALKSSPRYLLLFGPNALRTSDLLKTDQKKAILKVRGFFGLAIGLSANRNLAYDTELLALEHGQWSLSRLSRRQRLNYFPQL